jgi:hypothetical protein
MFIHLSIVCVNFIEGKLAIIGEILIIEVLVIVGATVGALTIVSVFSIVRVFILLVVLSIVGQFFLRSVSIIKSYNTTKLESSSSLSLIIIISSS